MKKTLQTNHDEQHWEAELIKYDISHKKTFTKYKIPSV